MVEPGDWGFNTTRQGMQIQVYVILQSNESKGVNHLKLVLNYGHCKTNVFLGS